MDAKQKRYDTTEWIKRKVNFVDNFSSNPVHCNEADVIVKMDGWWLWNCFWCANESINWANHHNLGTKPFIFHDTRSLDQQLFIFNKNYYFPLFFCSVVCAHASAQWNFITLLLRNFFFSKIWNSKFFKSFSVYDEITRRKNTST